MQIALVRRVKEEEKVAIEKWGNVDRTPEHLLAALTEEVGEVAHAINHEEGLDQVNQEIVEAIGILSRLYNMLNGLVTVLNYEGNVIRVRITKIKPRQGEGK